MTVQLGFLPPRRVGLLGGSFNPAHDGHRHISLEALKRLGLDEVWWLVSPQNPLEAGRRHGAASPSALPARARKRDSPRIKVLDLEARLGTRYTIDTVAAIRRLFPRTRFVWLMGADNLKQIRHWRRWREIFRACAHCRARPAHLFSSGVERPCRANLRPLPRPAGRGAAPRRHDAARLDLPYHQTRSRIPPVPSAKKTRTAKKRAQPPSRASRRVPGRARRRPRPRTSRVSTCAANRASPTTC